MPPHLQNRGNSNFPGLLGTSDELTYEDALEVIISYKYKEPEKIKKLVDNILKKRPDLKKRVEDLCLQYKVNL